MKSPYKDFTSRLKVLVSKHPDLITTTLSNIFTMRLIGNKTHGDLAEIAITDKDAKMFPRLQQEKGDIVGSKSVFRFFNDPASSEFSNINVLPLIYNEKKMQCNILVFDYDLAEDIALLKKKSGLSE